MHNLLIHMHVTISFCLFVEWSQNSANTSSLCARARRSSQQTSLTPWTPSGPMAFRRMGQAKKRMYGKFLCTRFQSQPAPPDAVRLAEDFWDGARTWALVCAPATMQLSLFPGRPRFSVFPISCYCAAASVVLFLFLIALTHTHVMMTCKRPIYNENTNWQVW